MLVSASVENCNNEFEAIGKFSSFSNELDSQISSWWHHEKLADLDPPGTSLPV